MELERFASKDGHLNHANRCLYNTDFLAKLFLTISWVAHLPNLAALQFTDPGKELPGTEE